MPLSQASADLLASLCALARPGKTPIGFYPVIAGRSLVKYLSVTGLCETATGVGTASGAMKRDRRGGLCGREQHVELNVRRAFAEGGDDVNRITFGLASWPDTATLKRDLRVRAVVTIEDEKRHRSV